MLKNKKGQIWVETVIYTLIAIVTITAVLAIAQPRIEEMQDKALIEQSAGVLSKIDNTLISLAQEGVGNKRVLELGVKDGTFKIDGENNQIIFEMDSSYMYSEPGANIFNGKLLIHTRKKGDEFFVNMTQSYLNYNITFDGKDELRIINKASTPYQLFISNKGKDASNKIILDFDIE